MKELFLFIMSSIGFTHLFIDSPIFREIRDFVKYWIPESINKFLFCHPCFGVLSGALCGWLLGYDTWQSLLSCGFAGSFLGGFSAMIFNYIEARTIVSLDESYPEQPEQVEPKNPSEELTPKPSDITTRPFRPIRSREE